MSLVQRRRRRRKIRFLPIWTILQRLKRCEIQLRTTPSDNVVASCPNKKNNDEDADEIVKMFKIVRRKKKEEKNAAEIALQVENMMATLEIDVEDDVELNNQGKPAINKLLKLPLLNEALSKKQLQGEFLDHGYLTFSRAG